MLLMHEDMARAHMAQRQAEAAEARLLGAARAQRRAERAVQRARRLLARTVL